MKSTKPGKAPKKSIGLVLLAILVTLAGRYLQGDEAAAESASPARIEAPGGTAVAEPAATERVAEPAADEDDDAEDVKRAFAAHRSDLQVELTGEVERTLADDLEGSRHQRFVLRLRNDHTVLVAHNIDLAPRVPLDEGDTVTVYGEYEWNERGGVVHWTHDDPKGWHEDGWIRHAGRVYE